MQAKSSDFFSVDCKCGNTGGVYPIRWAGMWENQGPDKLIKSHNGCSNCRNDIRRMIGLPLLDNPAMVLFEDRVAGRGAGSQMRLAM